MAVTIEPISYGGWPNCYRVSNGEIELVATADVGPRILRFGFVAGRNFFVEIPDQLGKSGEPWWMPRGGHRLWIAPEIVPDTYALDNSPVTATVLGNRLSLLQRVEPETGLQKEISVELAPDGVATITHRIENRGAAPRRFAPWALTQMATGGIAITAFPPRGGHDECLLPTNPLVMWAYTNFSDPRWIFTKRYLLLKQDPNDHSPQKTGLFSGNTMGAYLLGTDLFLKRAQADRTATYPDFGCSFEMFSNGDFLELETLGPLTTLAPGSSVTHIEHWSVHPDIGIAAFTDDELDRVLQPLLA